MKDEFAHYAKGIDQKFKFKGYEFRLTTEVDDQGNVKTVHLDSGDVSPAVRASIQDEAEMISAGLRAGATLDGVIDTFAPKSGVGLYPVVMMDSANGKSSLANHIWGAAAQVLKQEYRPENVFAIPAPKRQNPFRVIEGGLA